MLNIFILLLLILGNLFISYELYSKIDDYILVYNYLKKSCFFILCIPNKTYNIKFLKLKFLTHTRSARNDKLKMNSPTEYYNLMVISTTILWLFYLLSFLFFFYTFIPQCSVISTIFG